MKSTPKANPATEAMKILMTVSAVTATVGGWAALATGEKSTTVNAPANPSVQSAPVEPTAQPQFAIPLPTMPSAGNTAGVQSAPQPTAALRVVAKQQAPVTVVRQQPPVTTSSSK